MAGQEDDEGVFCNYCDEKVSLYDEAYQHVAREHGQEIHSGIGEHDPAMKTKATVMGVVGTVVSMVVYAAVLMLWGDELGGDAVIAFTIAYVVLLIAILFVTEFHYGRRGEKDWDEVVDDLVTYCPVCGIKLRLGDRNPHLEAYHPEERAIERRVYVPMMVVVVTLFGVGLAGILAAGYLGEEEKLSTNWVIVMFVASCLTLVSGFVVSYAFERLYHEPHMKELAGRRSGRGPGQGG